MLITAQLTPTHPTSLIHIDTPKDTHIEHSLNAIRVRLGGDITTESKTWAYPYPLVQGQDPVGQGSHLCFTEPAWQNLSHEPAISYVRIVSGTGTGTIYACSSGIVAIGASPRATIQVGQPYVGADDLVINIAADGTMTPTYIPAHDPLIRLSSDIRVGQPLQGIHHIGFKDCVVELGAGQWGTSAAVIPSESGTLKYTRPPRLLPEENPTDFHLPRKPDEPEKQPLPWLMAVMPLVTGIVMALVFSNPRMLIFGLLSPFMLGAAYVTRGKNTKKRYLSMVKAYEEERSQTEADARQALDMEAQQRLYDHPDATVLGMTATTPTTRLWERRPGDPTWLNIRLGSTTTKSNIKLNDPNQLHHKREVYWEIPFAPVFVDLTKVGVLGVASRNLNPAEATHVGSWITTQLALLHSPSDLSLYLLVSPGNQGASRSTTWSFFPWLPHSYPLTSSNSLRRIGSTMTTISARIAELNALLDQRIEESQEQSSSRYVGPVDVVVMDGAATLRSLPGMARILKLGPRYGIYSICLNHDERVLPEECEAVFVVDGPRSILTQHRSETQTKVSADLVTPDWLDWVSRSIARIEDSTPTTNEATIPDQSRLLEVLSLENPTKEDILARWRMRGRSTVATIGESLGGPFSIDLVKDGPHGLIGGTTGSGKSEFLQTIIASLAVANTPSEINFVLIDYKGGAAFKDCEHLPHTVGMVTDLDTHLVERALVSLGAELQRREHLLAQVGAKDLEDYQDIAVKQALPSLPRLLVVADEFASLARELPQFITGLVNLAQRGRSLGIHLLLATQRPSGAISPEIRANTNLRIALRMTDGAESTDVINSPEAGNISKSTPGRALARLGANSLIPFQASRVGGRAPGTTEDSELIAPMVTTLTFDDLGCPPPRREKEEGATDVEVTDLKLLVESIKQAYVEGQYPQPRRPWLPQLPPQIEFASLLSTVAEGSKNIVFGIQDVPEKQAQIPATFDLVSAGNLFVIGAPRSGRTTTLRTIAVSAAHAFSPGELHMYVLDCGNGGLLSLQDLPHVGAVVLRHQTETIRKFLSRLLGELSRRQEEMASTGTTSLQALQALRSDDAPADVLVLVDAWEAFYSAYQGTDGGAFIDSVIQLLREGPSVGIHLIVAGDRQLATSSKLATLAEDKVMLRMVDKSDYSTIGANPRQISDDMPQGRALSSSDATELQIAGLGITVEGGPESYISTTIAGIAHHWSNTAQERLPFTIAELPRLLSARDLALHTMPTDQEHYLLLGIGGDNTAPLYFNPLEGPCFLVAGPPKSGRTTAAIWLASEGARRGYHTVFVSAKNETPSTPGWEQSGVVVLHGADLDEDSLAPHIGLEQPTLIVVDDAHLLAKCPADLYLRELITHATTTKTALVVAGDIDELGKGFSGWIVEARKGKSGMLLSPSELTHGNLIGLKLSRSETRPDIPPPPGRAFTNVGDPTSTKKSLQIPIYLEVP